MDAPSRPEVAPRRPSIRIDAETGSPQRERVTQHRAGQENPRETKGMTLGATTGVVVLGLTMMLVFWKTMLIVSAGAGVIWAFAVGMRWVMHVCSRE